MGASRFCLVIAGPRFQLASLHAALTPNPRPSCLPSPCGREAERARAAAIKEKAKEQLAALAAEAGEAVDEAKEAAAAVKCVGVGRGGVGLGWLPLCGAEGREQETPPDTQRNAPRKPAPPNACPLAPPLPPCREAEKAASALLQQASQARGLIDQAASAAAAALQQIEALKGAEKEAAAQVAEARNELKQLTSRK